jgi:hypothetical protein
MLTIRSSAASARVLRSGQRGLCVKLSMVAFKHSLTHLNVRLVIGVDRTHKLSE